MPSNDKPLVSIITINYNGRKLTEDLLKSLDKITYPKVEVIVVDNASKESLDGLETDFPAIKLLKSEENLGFAGGNNLGIKHAKGAYFLLINNDAEADPGFLEPMVERMQSHPEIGIISPKIVYHFAQDTIQYAGGKPISLTTGRGSFIGSKAKDDGTYDTSGYTDLSHGAAMMIRREVVEKIGMMPDFYFLYYEELDYCEAVKKAGFKLWYEAKSRVLHKESMTVGKLSPLKSYYMNRNRVAFLRRHAEGWRRRFSILWFVFISLPSQTIRFFIKGQLNLISPMFKGAFWNLSNKVKFPNPSL
jgi:GT2 family glycosyltransferase